MASAGKLYHAPHELRLVTVPLGGARWNDAFRRAVPLVRSQYRAPFSLASSMSYKRSGSLGIVTGSAPQNTPTPIPRLPAGRRAL
jgi:hypothetical protein